MRAPTHRTALTAWRLFCLSLSAVSSVAGAGSAEGIEELEEIVVSAGGASSMDFPQTLRTYDTEEIIRSAPRQLADFFRSNAIGHLQEYSAGHSAINLRGASTLGAGQAWSDASEVAILINGRSSGTANLAKLSLYDIANIGILRGPNSVRYGSSAIGGVINLITKDGESFKGTELTTLFSSFARYSQIIQHGGKEGAVDYYLELSATASGDYDTGRGSSGHQPNTDYKQRSANLTLGYDIDALNRVQFLFRQDGVYHAGHPGATYSLTDYDDRYGTTLELIYTGSTRDGRFSWTNQTFYNRDVDELHWSQNPLIGLIPALLAPGLIGTPGITRDVNNRTLQEWGNRFSTEIRISEDNTLTLGNDLKYSELDNRRVREAAPGYRGGLLRLSVVQPPLSVDARGFTSGIFLEDLHRFLDDKVTVRAGGRYEHIRQKALPTQNSAITESTRERDIFVYQGSVTYTPRDWLAFRGNIGTGFLSANPTQLFGTVRQTNGFASVANPDLKDEKSIGWDLGTRISKGGFTFDASLYENKVEDYINGVLVGPGMLQWRNVGEKSVRGIEVQTSYDIAEALSWKGWTLVPYLSGNYYLKNESFDINRNSAGQLYVNDYNANVGIHGGRTGRWDANLFVTLAGPARVTAGFLQNANVGTANVGGSYYTPKTAILNFSGSYRLGGQANLFFGINNILDRNYSTFSYVLNNGSTADVAPYLLPGTASGEGISSPGREYFVGVSLTF